MKATEFPYEELNEATQSTEAFTFYQIIGDKNWIYWEIPILTRYDIEIINEIVKYTYYQIYAENNITTIRFLIKN